MKIYKKKPSKLGDNFSQAVMLGIGYDFGEMYSDNSLSFQGSLYLMHIFKVAMMHESNVYGYYKLKYNGYFHSCKYMAYSDSGYIVNHDDCGTYVPNDAVGDLSYIGGTIGALIPIATSVFAGMGAGYATRQLIYRLPEAYWGENQWVTMINKAFKGPSFDLFVAYSNLPGNIIVTAGANIIYDMSISHNGFWFSPELGIGIKF